MFCTFKALAWLFLISVAKTSSKRENDLSELRKSQKEGREDRKDRKVAVLHGKCKDIASWLRVVDLCWSKLVLNKKASFSQRMKRFVPIVRDGEEEGGRRRGKIGGGKRKRKKIEDNRRLFNENVEKDDENEIWTKDREKVVLLTIGRHDDDVVLHEAETFVFFWFDSFQLNFVLKAEKEEGGAGEKIKRKSNFLTVRYRRKRQYIGKIRSFNSKNIKGKHFYRWQFWRQIANACGRCIENNINSRKIPWYSQERCYWEWLVKFGQASRNLDLLDLQRKLELVHCNQYARNHLWWIVFLTDQEPGIFYLCKNH